MALTTGDTLQNRYRIVSPLARGGMAAIYRAWHLALNAPVAIKEMTPQPGLDLQTLAQLRQQFQQEAAVLAHLDHPNLVRVTDFFEEGDNAYLVMDMVAGESLDDRVERQGALPEDEVLAWADQLLDALAYCHGQGVIHRDVKPQNVIIRPDRQASPKGGGDAVLVDFGLVKLWDPDDPRTKTAMQGMGTPEYAPPEQYDAGAGHTDPRSDIYSLGATLYHLLTGQAPPTATQRMVNPAALEPPRALNPDLSIHTEQVILRALEPQPDHRFQSAQEMADVLTAALEDEAYALGGESPTSPYPAGTTPAGWQAAPPQQRIPGWAKVLGGIVLGSMAFLVLVIGLVIAGWPTAPASTQAPTVPRSVIAVTATPLSPTPTPNPIEGDLLVRFGDFAELVGYSLPAAEVTTDRPLQLTLNWRALDKQSPVDYTVFTHLCLDDGIIIAQHDGPPAGGARPMSGWTPGETIEDHRSMTLAPGISYTGPATIVVGLYDPNTSGRVPTDAGSDHVILPITIRIVAGN